jgi:hypothetical protein
MNTTASESSRENRSLTQESSVVPARTSLAFPPSGYVGVMAKFADLYSQEYEPAKEFFYFDGLALLGTLLSGRLRVDFGSLTTQPRLYLLKVAKSGWRRKSTATRLAEKFIRKALEEVKRTDDLMVTPGETADSWMFVLPGAGSAEGLIEAFEKHRRVALIYDEFRRFEKKGKVEGSVLVSMVNELFDRNEYSNYTKKSPVAISDSHLGFLSNTTEENYEQLVDAEELVGSGLLNRFLIIPSDSVKRIPKPKDPPEAELVPVRAELVGYLSKLLADGQEIVLTMTPEAEQLWTDWYMNLDETEETTRLDNIGMRLMALFAFTSGKDVVDEEVMKAVIVVLEWQQKVRETYRPNPGQTPIARMEQNILKQLAKRDMTKSDLYKFTNAYRFGAKIFKDAIANLRDNKQIKEVLSAGSKTARFVLVKES